MDLSALAGNFRSTSQTACIARPATSWILTRLSTGLRLKAAEDPITKECNFGTRCESAFFVVFSQITVRLSKTNHALDNFFKRDSCGFMLGGVDIDAWSRAALKLLAALGGDNYQAIFRINFRDVVFRCFVQFRLRCSDSHRLY